MTGDSPFSLASLGRQPTFAQRREEIDRFVDRLAEALPAIKTIDQTLIECLAFAAAIELDLVAFGVTQGQAVRWRAEAFRDGRRRNPNSMLSLVCAWPEPLPATADEAKRRHSEFLQLAPEDRPAHRRLSGEK